MTDRSDNRTSTEESDRLCLRYAVVSTALMLVGAAAGLPPLVCIVKAHGCALALSLGYGLARQVAAELQRGAAPGDRDDVRASGPCVSRG